MELIRVLEHFAQNNELISYALISIFVIIEGEFTLIASGILAYIGAFNLPSVFVFAGIGAFFKPFVGYWMGGLLVKYFPESRFLKYIEKKILRIFPTIHEKPFWSIFTSKFIYGINNLTLIFAGYIKLPFRKFILSELLSTFFWYSGLISIGYFFSRTAFSLTRDVRKVSLIILACIIGFVIIERFIVFLFDTFDSYRYEERTRRRSLFSFFHLKSIIDRTKTIIFSGKEKVIAVHSGSFHADDIFAVAALSIYLDSKGERYRIVRTRNEAEINNADFVVDVGGKYDPDNNRFDHHQVEGAGKREDVPNIPYASFGLVWKKYGEALCGSKKVAQILDEKIVEVIDAPDNGISVSSPLFKNIFSYDFHSIVAAHRPTWKEKDADMDLIFSDIVSFAKRLLSREIKKAIDNEIGKDLVRNAYEIAKDKRILVLDDKYPWEYVSDEMPEVLIVIAPSENGKFKAECMRVEAGSFNLKIRFPDSWAGLRDNELSKVSGVTDAIFCHRNLFLAVAGSKDGAIALAKIAISN